MKIAFSDIVAVIALLVSLCAVYVSKRVATSDFAATQKVKSDMAELIAVLRSIMTKGALYTQQVREERDNPDSESFIDTSSERDAITKFMHSSTACAFYSFAVRKSKEAREKGIDGESWRIFFSGAIRAAIIKESI